MNKAKKSLGEAYMDAGVSIVGSVYSFEEDAPSSDCHETVLTIKIPKQVVANYFHKTDWEGSQISFEDHFFEVVERAADRFCNRADRPLKPNYEDQMVLPFE